MSGPISLRPVRAGDTAPPPPMPTREEREAAFERNLYRLAVQLPELHEKQRDAQLALAQSSRDIRELWQAYNGDVTVVTNYDTGGLL